MDWIPLRNLQNAAEHRSSRQRGYMLHQHSWKPPPVILIQEMTKIQSRMWNFLRLCLLGTERNERLHFILRLFQSLRTITGLSAILKSKNWWARRNWARKRLRCVFLCNVWSVWVSRYESLIRSRNELLSTTGYWYCPHPSFLLYHFCVV